MRPWGAVPSHPLRGSPGRLRGSRLGGFPGRLLSASLWLRHSTRCTRPSFSVTRDLGRTSTPPVVATAEWVHWYGHHPATLRYRDANPRRARSHLGTRHPPRPPPPGTITTGNHRNQINQPPQNPGLDRHHPHRSAVLGGRTPRSSVVCPPAGCSAACGAAWCRCSSWWSGPQHSVKRLRYPCGSLGSGRCQVFGRRSPGRPRSAAGRRPSNSAVPPLRTKLSLIRLVTSRATCRIRST